MDIQELRREAQTMQPQLTADRRRLHRNPEAGAVLPETVAYVKGRLTEMGYHPQELGGGLTATVTGTDTGRCILLRADMDALPLRVWMRCASPSRPTCPFARRTAVCTPAATICTLPCCWVRPSC